MASTRELKVTGRMVLLTLLSFFVVIAAVNALMATLAIRTFGGLEIENAYKAGLEFSQEISAAKAQQLRNLKVDLETQQVSKETRFKLSVSNMDVTSLEPLRVRIELRHPADKRHDRILRLRALGNGIFAENINLEAGQWNARIFIDQGQQSIFRSVNRITIR